MANASNLKTIQDLFGTVTKHGYDQPLAPMWRNGRRNGLKIRWAVKGPCRFESGHRQIEIASCGLRITGELGVNAG